MGPVFHPIASPLWVLTPEECITVLPPNAISHTTSVLPFGGQGSASGREPESMATTQVEIARRVGLDVSSVNKILNRRPGPVFKQATIDRVFRVAKQLGYSLDRLKRSHRRSHERRKAGFPGKLVLQGADGSRFDQGTCLVSDIALCGASLVDVELPKGRLPVEAFTILLEMSGKKEAVIEVRGRVVRLNHDGKSLRLGIAFQGVGPDLEAKIASLTR